MSLAAVVICLDFCFFLYPHCVFPGTLYEKNRLFFSVLDLLDLLPGIAGDLFPS
ncbi:MAG TPA: hypothetical protein P5263_04265 [Methanoregulaceae archaeon]|nr:hypothetical protein [Methanoregulaceae archaeon]